MEFQTEFLEDTENIYGAPLQEVDFKTNHEGSREIINDWVSEQTMEILNFSGRLYYTADAFGFNQCHLSQRTMETSF